MLFGTEVGLGPGDIVIDGDLAPPRRRGIAPIFGPCLLWPNGWMDQDATWSHCVRWEPSPPPQGAQPPIFGPCLLWPNGRPSQLLVSSCTNRYDMDVIYKAY